MRVLMLDNEFPPLGGGTGMVNKHLLEGLARLGGIQVDLVTSSRSRDRTEHEVLFPGIELHKVPVDNRIIHHATYRELLRYALRGYVKSRELLRAQRYDLCFAFATFPAGVVALVLNATHRLPYAVSLQGPDVPGYEARYKRIYPLLRPVARLVWKRARAVTAINGEMCQLAWETLPGLEMDTIYNGVDARAIRPRSWEVLPAPDEVRTAICVARLIEHKGHHHLLDAAAILKQRGWDKVRIQLVGTGDAEGALREQCRRLGLEEWVDFRGFVPWEQVLELYRQAHLFVLPSFAEGMSIALLEAMASGLPVVATDNGGNRELVGERNGRLVPWADAAALADRLGELLGSPEKMASMGQASREIAERFDWEVFTQRHVELFGRVAGPRPAG